jgi:hypothetical protein
LDDLDFKGFGVRGSLPHGDPDHEGNSIHIFLSGERCLIAGPGNFVERLGEILSSAPTLNGGK